MQGQLSSLNIDSEKDCLSMPTRKYTFDITDIGIGKGESSHQLKFDKSNSFGRQCGWGQHFNIRDR